MGSVTNANNHSAHKAQLDPLVKDHAFSNYPTKACLFRAQKTQGSNCPQTVVRREAHKDTRPFFKSTPPKIKLSSIQNQAVQKVHT